MKFFQLSFVAASVFMMLTMVSCDKDSRYPIIPDSSVTIANTIQSDALTGGVETPIEAVFGVDENSLQATASISEDVEFPAYLLGLYDVDMDRRRISFELVAAADDPTYSDFFRTLEAGTTDRYYLTFADGHNVDSFESDNSSVNLRIDSENVLVVEIGEGFNFNPGSSFTIDLEK